VNIRLGPNGLSAIILVVENNTVNNYVIVTTEVPVRVKIRNARVNQQLKNEIVIIQNNAVPGRTLIIIGPIVLKIMFVVGMETDGEDKFVCVVV